MNAEPTDGRARTTLRMSGRVEFRKNSWLKSIIEKNALEGVKSYFEDLDKLMKELVVAESVAEAVIDEMMPEVAELRRRSRGIAPVPEEKGIAQVAAASAAVSAAKVEGVPLFPRQKGPGLGAILGGMLLSVLRYLGGEDEPGVRRIATAVLGLTAFMVLMGCMLLLWKLNSNVAEMNGTLAAIRMSLLQQQQQPRGND